MWSLGWSVAIESEASMKRGVMQLSHRIQELSGTSRDLIFEHQGLRNLLRDLRDFCIYREDANQRNDRWPLKVSFRSLLPSE